jgi:hypothetical protein
MRVKGFDDLGGLPWSALTRQSRVLMLTFDPGAAHMSRH